MIAVLIVVVVVMVGLDSSVGIATRYELDGSGIEYRRWRDFPHTSKPPPGGPPSLLQNGYRVPFPGAERRDVTLTTHPHLVKRLKKEQNYIYIYNYKTNSMEHSPY
jgi:hypothetical protein